MTTSAAGGFSLIEVLISILVLTVGVIGATGMQLTALKTSRLSSFQTTALHLALEMADHIRSHTRYMQPGDAHNPYLAIDFLSADQHAAIHAGSNCFGMAANCNAGQLASFEIALWLQRIETELPGARVRVCRDAQPWDAGRRQYSWDCTPGKDEHAYLPVFIKIGWPDNGLEFGPAVSAGKDFPPVLVLPVAVHTP